MGGRWFYRARFLRSGRFHVRAETISVPGLPPGLEGLRIAHLSDLHGGHFMRAGDLRDVVEEINRREVDLCVLTGDFISHHWRDALPLAADLGRISSRFGTLAVFGNHDYRERQEARIAESFEAGGVRFLRNECARFDTGAGILAVTGLEDLEEGKRIDPAAARAQMRAGDIELMLCHNPHGAAALARPECVAILSGHTHGTQLNLPYLRRFGPPHPGERLQCGTTAVIVNRGLGVVAVPLRFRSPAEVVLVTLHRGDPGEAER